MIRVITGKPGAGKSLFATILALRALVEADRWVVTNLPLRLPRLREAFQKRRKDDQGINPRVRVLEENEVSKFWHIRPDDAWPNPQKGCLYIIDEAHLIFHARKWAELTGEATSYFSQHRHHGDDILLVTQHVDMLDKQVRVLIGEYVEVQNRASRVIRGFRAGGGFKAKVYDMWPIKPGILSNRSESYSLTGDEMECYSTMGGVGITGKVSPPKRPPWRPNIWVGIAGAVILSGVLAWGGVRLITGGASFAAESMMPSEKTKAAAVQQVAPQKAPAAAVIGSPVAVSPARRPESYGRVSIGDSTFLWLNGEWHEVAKPQTVVVTP